MRAQCLTQHPCALQGLPELQFVELATCHSLCDVLLCSGHFAGFLTSGGKLQAAAIIAAAWMIQVCHISYV